MNRLTKRSEVDGKFAVLSEAVMNCSVCKLTINHRGWLSSFADELEE